MLIDPRGSTYVLFYDTFDRLRLDPDDTCTFQGSLVGLFDEHVKVKSYIMLETIFRLDESAKIVEVNYLVVNTSLSYNIILGRPALNLLGGIISILHLNMKYLLYNG